MRTPLLPGGGSLEAWWTKLCLKSPCRKIAPPAFSWNSVITRTSGDKPTKYSRSPGMRLPPPWRMFWVMNRRGIPFYQERPPANSLPPVFDRRLDLGEDFVNPSQILGPHLNHSPTWIPLEQPL